MKKKKKYVTPKIHKQISEKYSDGFRQSVISNNLPSEAIMSDSYVTLVGRNELWIENYKALLSYEEEKIIVQAKEYMLCIEGTNLIISHYMEEHMMIRGNIRKITYL